MGVHPRGLGVQGGERRKAGGTREAGRGAQGPAGAHPRDRPRPTGRPSGQLPDAAREGCRHAGAPRAADAGGYRRSHLHVGDHRQTEGRDPLSRQHLLQHQCHSRDLRLHERRPFALVPAMGALLRPDVRAARPGQHGMLHRHQRRRPEPDREPRGREADDPLRRAAHLQSHLRRREQADRRASRDHPGALSPWDRRRDSPAPRRSARPHRSAPAAACGPAHLLDHPGPLRWPPQVRRERQRRAESRRRELHRCAGHRGVRGLRPHGDEPDRDRQLSRASQDRQRRQADSGGAHRHRQGRHRRRPARRDRRLRAERDAGLPQPTRRERGGAHAGRRISLGRHGVSRARRLPLHHGKDQGAVQTRDRQVRRALADRGGAEALTLHRQRDGVRREQAVQRGADRAGRGSGRPLGTGEWGACRRRDQRRAGPGADRQRDREAQRVVQALRAPGEVRAGERGLHDRQRHADADPQAEAPQRARPLREAARSALLASQGGTMPRPPRRRPGQGMACLLVVLASIVSFARNVGAAGFQVNEQSARGLGSAFAGEAAAAEDASTIFFNPAGMPRLSGTQFVSAGFAIKQSATYDNGGSRLNSAVGGGTVSGSNDGNGTPMALLQTLFISHELLSDRAWIGLGASTPYGLKTSWTPGWVGRYHAIDSELITVNVNPSLALKLTRWLSIGGGADIDYARARLTNALDLGTICQLTARWALLSDITWTPWSQFDQLVFNFENPKQPTIVQPERWKDSFRYSVGTRYEPTRRWSFRLGAAYDETPVPDDAHRTARIPDADRIWASFGIGFRFSDRVRLDFGYAHLFALAASARNPDAISGNVQVRRYSAPAA